MLPRSGGGAGSRLAITPTGAGSCNRGHRWLTGNGYLPCLAAWPPIVSPNRSRRPTEGEVRPTAATATTERSFGYESAERSQPTGWIPPFDLRGPTRLPPSGFTYSWTLSSKFFATFPHGTCLLSVSWKYLALGGVYHPLRAALPSNPTPGREPSSGRWKSRTGLAPALGSGPGQGDLGSREPEGWFLPNATLPAALWGRGLRRWALPRSLAVTRGILVSFFSSA